MRLDHPLSWRPQVNFVCSKATRILNFLRCNLRNCPKNLKELSYKQFVLPVLEYTATIGDPYHQNDISKIEMMQHRAAHFVLSRPWRRNIMLVTVSAHIVAFAWAAHSTLQLRRKCTRLILMYKFLNNLLSVPLNYLLAPSLITTTRSSHDFKIMSLDLPSLDCCEYLFPKTAP